ncbi:PB1 domain, RWP-RK domain, Lambda repressor-like, DNA-binding domain protein [Artemisia annua]|uniref:PB1 domain, RWP-RK domain, Lambda repressor-like, DNA-binding domain protein n=1 Tax=Artemisia annua TaxID=35608 RepID=A0A2U1MLN5_ARTAN|nr:PB1 domain, RWP-RK domain, Lambda repressor-like, DNA-binding domain protein [Artemisia annua]
MISDAIATLKELNGSSQYAIRKFIEDKYKDLPVNFKKMLLIQLKKLVASHKLVKIKASFKLPSTAKPKPKVADKPKPAAKKAPAKKKPAAKSKLAAKAKLAPKAKPAAKTVMKKAPAKKKPAKAKAGSAKAAAKPNPTPKAMLAGNNSNKPARQRKKSAGLITVEEITKHYGKSFEEAADILGVSRSKLKRICTSLGIKGWPYTPNKNDSHSLNFRGSNEHNPATHTENAVYSSTRVETILIDELGQPKTTLKNSVKPLTIKATYKEDTVRFPFILSDGLTKLKEQIATRFPLKLESFRLKYEDKDGDMILIACDSDLDLSANDFRQPNGHTVIRLVVCLLTDNYEIILAHEAKKHT